MYQDLESQSKRCQFRNQIRRKQIQQRFQAQRMKFAEDLIRDEQEEITKQLDTPEKKKQWIIKKSLEMGETPKKAWFQILRSISIGMRAFSDGNFDWWLEARLIQKITALFKQEYQQLQLSNIAACIMQDIFYYLPQQSWQINQILQYQFIIDIVELCANQYTAAQYYYQLISTMIENRNYLRNMFISNGLVQVLTTRLKGYLEGDVETDEVCCALTVAFKLVKIYDIPGGTAMAKGNVIFVFIPILDAYLVILKREDSIRVVLKAFASLSMSQKQYIISNLFESPNLVNCLMHTLCQKGNPANRSISAATIASILSSKNRKYSEQLIARGILNQVLECSKFENKLQTCLTSLLQIVSNIVVNTLDDARSVISHPLFGQFVMPCANQLQSPKLHETAIYILCSLVEFQNFHMMQLLLKKYNILQSFIMGLNQEIPSLNNCLQILRALSSLVKMYNDIYTGDVNKITLELERMYNINNVLTSLEERVGSKKVHRNIQLLIDNMNKE